MRVYNLTTAQFALSNIALRRLKVARFNDLNDPFELLAVDVTNFDLRVGMSAKKNKLIKQRVCFVFQGVGVTPSCGAIMLTNTEVLHLDSMYQIICLSLLNIFMVFKKSKFMMKVLSNQQLTNF